MFLLSKGRLAISSLFLEGTNILIRGAWNQAIQHPDWLVKHVPSLSEPSSKPALEMMIFPFRVRVGFEDFFINPSQKSLTIEHRRDDPEIFNKISKISEEIYSQLQHTPITGVGHNFAFILDAEEVFISFDNAEDGMRRLNFNFHYNLENKPPEEVNQVLASFSESYTIAEKVKDAMKKDIAVAKHLGQMLDSAPFLDEWEINGIQRPTQQCREKALSLAQDIFKEYFCLPVRIASSIEEGIMLVYFDQKKSCSLKIEVYNSFEIAGLVNQNKSTKLCIDVNNSSDIEQLFQAFKE